jgi:hypothetical protein
MRKLLTFLIALGAIVFAVAAPSHAAWIKSAQPFESYLQPVGGVFLFVKRPISNYIGPGDITFNGSAANVKEFWSCSRVVNNAHATTATSLCDLVQAPTGASPGAAVGTLRGTTAGPVDLTAYFPGGVTPAAACSAITGGCCVSNAYGQIGGIGNATNAANATQPCLVFSGLNGLPVMNCPSTTSDCILATTGTITLPQPFVMAAVYIRNPTSSAIGQIVGGGTSTTTLNSSSVNVANRFGCVASGGGGFQTATDVVWHGAIALFSGTTGSITSVDGTNTPSQNCGTAGFSAEAIRLFRGPGGIEQMNGSIAEAMIVGSTAATGDFTNWFSNANGSNGYNGALP